MKYRNPIKINIPEPCHEDWNTMTPNGCGRFCASCQKTVIDFTVMTDAEIFNALKNSSNLCGRFLPDQLNRPVALPQYRKSFPFRQKIVAGLLALQAFTVESFAQGKKKAPTAILHKKAGTTPQKRIIKGRLLDFKTNQPVSGIHLLFMANGYDPVAVVTDKHGHFIIHIPKHYIFDTATLHQSDTILVSPKLHIPDEYISWKNLQQEITMYRYHTTILPAAQITGTYEKRKPLTQPYETTTFTTGLLYYPMTEKKPNFWQKITRPFRKKHH